MKLVSVIFILFFIFAAKSSASVFINEVAWMGTTASTTEDEWMELRNDGNENVDLENWTLTAQDGIPNIIFSGDNLKNKTIPANGYFLLERTDDQTLPFIVADLIYTGALSNGGEILILKDKNGGEIDKINASNGWPAGDNANKLTMQKISSGWITAIGTPKSANAGQSSNQSSSSSSQENYSSNISSVANSGGGSVFWPDEQQIYANAGKDKTGIAGADVLFEGKALGIKKEPLENARYLWNFGDGASGGGKNIKHTYKYPGNYIVVLDVSSGQYSVSDKTNVKITPNELIISEAGDEFIKLKNKSGIILDISGWFLTGGGVLFKFPESSFISANSELIISSDVSKIKFSGKDDTVNLLYSNGSTAFSYQNKKETKLQPIMPAAVSSSSHADKVTQIIHPAKNPEPTTVVGSGATATQLASVIYSSEENKNGNNYKIWLYLALFLGLFSGGALFFIRRQSLS